MEIIFFQGGGGLGVGDKNRLKSQREKIEDYAREMAFSIKIEQC